MVSCSRKNIPEREAVGILILLHFLQRGVVNELHQRVKTWDSRAICSFIWLLAQRKMFRYAFETWLGLCCQATWTWIQCGTQVHEYSITFHISYLRYRTAGRNVSEYNAIYSQKLVLGLNLTQGVYTNTVAGRITVTVWLPPAGKGLPSGACLCTLPVAAWSPTAPAHLAQLYI